MHPDTGQVDVFARSDSALDEPRVTKTIKVPNGEWSITMSRPASFTFQIMLGLALSLLTAVVFALLIRRILREPERLRELVKQQTAQLEQLAFNDELTGLANRRFLTEQLEQALLNSQREGHLLALMYLDLDDFKRINDSSGHADGDILLMEVARRLKAAVRKTDMVGRLGGDEFAIILVNINSAENARLIAEKIIAGISRPVQLGQHEVVIGASIGITLAPQDGTSSGELLRNADLAMYDSKRAGKTSSLFTIRSCRSRCWTRYGSRRHYVWPLNSSNFSWYSSPSCPLPMAG
ncbi:GGDEF domain-containing protein [Oceanimonas sp. NS1]|nr:GGDEF domain-containing protein [Oceanimonas sp. NS1]